MQKIKIITPYDEFTAELNDSVTSQKLIDSLPITRSAHLWGDEIYFDVPFHAELDETAQEEVPVGGLAFWPTGDVMCIFFGKTPVSINGEPRAYSAVNIFGQVAEDALLFKKVQSGDEITVEVL